MCFCGQQTEGGRVADESQVGLPFLTGSEEERGPLFDVTGEHYEDTRAPVDRGDPHGSKMYFPGVGTGGVPNAVPLVAVRIGPQMIVTIPGEGTKEVGARIRAAVESQIAGSGIERVVMSGLANEFVLYFTTPEEYERQHYEGGNTHFGTLVVEPAAPGAGDAGRPPRARRAGTGAARRFDPTNGVSARRPRLRLGRRVRHADRRHRPSEAVRALRARDVRLAGRAAGTRPAARPRVRHRRAPRRAPLGRGSTTTSAWRCCGRSTASGRHDARGRSRSSAPLGPYRLVVTAKRYRLVSPAFDVERRELADASSRCPRRPAAWPSRSSTRSPVRDVDLTDRPRRASGGVVRFRVGDRSVRVRRGRSTQFSVAAPAGAPVTVEPGAARDAYGNFNRDAVKLR